MFPLLSQQSLSTVCYYDDNSPYDSRELPFLQRPNVPALGAKCFSPHDGPMGQDWLSLL